MSMTPRKGPSNPRSSSQETQAIPSPLFPPFSFHPSPLETSTPAFSAPQTQENYPPYQTGLSSPRRSHQPHSPQKLSLGPSLVGVLIWRRWGESNLSTNSNRICPEPIPTPPRGFAALRGVTLDSMLIRLLTFPVIRLFPPDLAPPVQPAKLGCDWPQLPFTLKISYSPTRCFIFQSSNQAS